jgi:hypothetical protein
MTMAYQNDTPDPLPPPCPGEPRHSKQCSERLLSCAGTSTPLPTNERDTNPPPPDETQPDASQSLLSHSPTGNEGDYTIIGKMHEG